MFKARALALLCGLAVGVYSLPAAFLNGLALGGPGPSGYMIGSALVGMLGVSWFGFSWGSKLFTGGVRIAGLFVIAAWLVATVTVLWLSASFVATHRGEVVSERQGQIERYQRAQAVWERTDAEIRTADGLGRLKTAEQRRQENRDATAKLDAGRPAEADALAETLSRVSGGRISVGLVGAVFPVWLTVAAELACIAAFTAWSSLGSIQASIPVEEPKPKKRRRRRSKPIGKPIDVEPDEGVVDFGALQRKRDQRANASWSP